MKKLFLLMAILGALGFLLHDFSSGHGGQYRGPGDTVPPNLGGPGDTTPPSNPGGPATPGPAGPTTAGPRGPATPGLGSGLGPRGATTGGLGRKRTAGGEGFERWEFWWENNKEPYLNLKNRMSQTGNVSGSSGFLSGRGRKSEAQTSKRPTPDIIKNEIVPALKLALNEDHPDILDSAVLALARVIRAEDADLVLTDITKVVGSNYQTAQQSATLSLGVLGSSKAFTDLYNLMIDSVQGKRLVGGKNEVPVLVRAFAALSMGFINSPEAVDKLITVIRVAPDKDKDLKACAITALGLMKGNERQEEIVNYLIKLMADDKMDPFIKASVPTSLGKIGDPVALVPIVNAFKKEKQNNWILQSCAIAMGLLANIEDTEVIKLLKGYIGDGSDDQTRHFSYISLGLIGARDQEFDKHSDLHKDISTFFMKEIVRPSKPTHLPWACLGAALHAREHEALQSDVIDRIAEKFDKENNPSYKGSMSVALGLLNASAQAKMLEDELDRTKDKALQGYLCIGMGLMNYSGAAEGIRNIAATEVASFRLRLQAATSLGLMGDTQAVSVLVKALQEGTTLSVTSSAAKALGLIGDTSAIAPLRDILQDRSANPLARAFSAVALGIIGEKTDLPWNSAVSEHYNYRAKVDAISEVLDIL